MCSELTQVETYRVQVFIQCIETLFYRDTLAELFNRKLNKIALVDNNST